MDMYYLSENKFFFISKLIQNNQVAACPASEKCLFLFEKRFHMVPVVPKEKRISN